MVIIGARAASDGHALADQRVRGARFDFQPFGGTVGIHRVEAEARKPAETVKIWSKRCQDSDIRSKTFKDFEIIPKARTFPKPEASELRAKT